MQKLIENRQIHKYGHQGIAKPGVKRDQHAIVYMGREEPRPADEELPARGERGMRSSIRVKPASQADALQGLLRVDYAHIVTVPHEVKAKSLGVVHRNSQAELYSSWEAVFAPKIFGSSGVKG